MLWWWLEGPATDTAAHGHGTAGSGDPTTTQPLSVTPQASVVFLRPSAWPRKEWERREGSWPRGAPTPASSRHGRGGGKRQCALTEAQSTRLKGGGGGGGHGEAAGGRGNAFSRWFARTAAAMLGRQWRTAELARRCVLWEERKSEMGRRVRSAGASGFKARLRRQEAHGAWLARQQAGNARRTCVRRFLKTVGHCSAHSVDLDRLTA